MKSLLTLLSIAMLFSAHSQTYMYVEDVLITPESPISMTDEVSIQVIGNFSNPGSFIIDHTITVDGFTVHLEINAGNDGEIHEEVLVPFDTTFTLGFFEPGEYTVELSGTSMGDFVEDESKFIFIITDVGAVGDNPELTEIQFFPNPTSEFLTIAYEKLTLNSNW